MRIVIEVADAYASKFLVWFERVGGGGLEIGRLGAKQCNSRDEVLEEVQCLLARVPKFKLPPEAEEEYQKLQRR